VFDVRVTGERGFANTYLLSQRVARGATTITLRDNRDRAKYPEGVTLTATVARRAANIRGVPRGSVQFTVNGERSGAPVPLDRRGQAVWRDASRAPGTHRVGATYIPAAGSGFLSSSTSDERVVSAVKD
jgi:hypothetical protein